MFRFSIRELMLVTLIVGLGLGWGMREYQLRRSESLWRMRAGGLERIFDSFGYDVAWGSDGPTVTVTKCNEDRQPAIYKWEYTTLYEPSADRPQPSPPSS